MRTIAIVNQKGGTGKTTTAVNLAACLAENDHRVLLIDLDPQANATSWYGVQEEGQGLFQVLVENGNLLDVVHQTGIGNVSIIPSSAWLLGAEKALAGEVGAELLLSRKLAAIEPPIWDYVLFDCPPTLGVLTINALVAAKEIIVPVEPNILALHGLAQLLQTTEVVRERLNPELSIRGILPCRVDKRTRHSMEVLDELQERFGSLLLGTRIRQNVRLAECPSFETPITHYASNSRGAQDYRALAQEIAL